MNGTVNEEGKPMGNETAYCEQTCRNSCAMLVESLRKETGLIRFYESVEAQCVDPDINAFFRDLIEARRATVATIVDKMNQIRARSASMDGVQSSFEP